jgi:hypothetical protein
VPATCDGPGPFYQHVIAVSPLEPWDATSAAYRLEILARTLGFPVDGARLVPSNNNDVWRLEHGYLRVADLEVTHPLHTLRRLIDAPLPLLAAGLY